MRTYLKSNTQDVQKTLDFYTKLGFLTIELGGYHYVYDAHLVIELDTEIYFKSGMILYYDDIDAALKSLGMLSSVDEFEYGYLTADPSSTYIYLVDKVYKKTIPQTDVVSKLGKFMGFSLDMILAYKGVEIWEALGFKITKGGIDQGYTVLTNKDGVSVSIVPKGSCPHLFINPSLSYFNGTKNLEVIQTIRDLNIPIVEEITHFNKDNIVDNIIIRDPGSNGIGFFLFSND